METLKNDGDKSMSTAQGYYERNFHKNIRALSIVEVSQLVYVSKLPRAVLASVADKVPAASYNKIMPRVSGP